jgi:hypothetical protein
MEIKFVTEDEVQHHSRGPKNIFGPFIAKLKKHPNRWAEFPSKINHSGTAYRIPLVFTDIEVKIKGGNNLKLDNPEKKDWTVYLKYTPENELL